MFSASETLPRRITLATSGVFGVRKVQSSARIITRPWSYPITQYLPGVGQTQVKGMMKGATGNIK